MTSSNLQLSQVNLKIIKYRVGGIKKHLHFMRRLAHKNADFIADQLFRRGETIEYLILDIKNPSDYLSPFRKIYNNVIPFLISYYLFVIPIVLVQQYDLWLILSKNNALLAIVASLVPIYFSFVVWTFRATKNWLIISSFKFNKSNFR